MFRNLLEEVKANIHLCCLLVTLLDVLPVHLRRLLVIASVRLRMQPGINM
jgi:hypothetical protein